MCASLSSFLPISHSFSCLSPPRSILCKGLFHKGLFFVACTHQLAKNSIPLLISWLGCIFCIFRVFSSIFPHLDFPPHMWYICITFRALCGRNPFQPDWRTVLWKESRPSRPGICAPARSMAAVGSARLPASLLARPAVALPTSSARTRRRLTGN